MYSTFEESTLYAASEPTPLHLGLPDDVVRAIRQTPEFSLGSMDVFRRTDGRLFHDMSRLAPHHWEQIFGAAMQDKREGRSSASERTMKIIGIIVASLGLAVAAVALLVAIVGVAIVALAASVVAAAVVAIIGLIVAIIGLGIAIVAFILSLILPGEGELWTLEQASSWLDAQMEKLGVTSVPIGEES